MAKSPQDQKCSLCDAEAHCVEVSVTTGGNDLFSTSENFWVCLLCSQTPIGELVRMAFEAVDKRDPRGAG